MRHSNTPAGASDEHEETQPGLLKRILHRPQSKKNPRRPSTTSLPEQQPNVSNFGSVSADETGHGRNHGEARNYHGLAPVDERETEGEARKVESTKKRSLRFRFRSASVPATDVVEPTFSRTYVPRHAATSFEQTTGSSAERRVPRNEVSKEITEGPSDFELFLQKAQEEDQNEKDDLLQSLARRRNRKTFVPDHPDVNFMFGDPKSRRRSGI